jgi:antitoxin MazE
MYRGFMKTRVQKWGNSLAVRIPKSFADEIGLEDESSVDVSVAKGKVVVAPIATERPYSLRRLLAKVTEENLHAEFDTGTSVGREVW